MIFTLILGKYFAIYFIFLSQGDTSRTRVPSEHEDSLLNTDDQMEQVTPDHVTECQKPAEMATGPLPPEANRIIAVNK